MSPHEIGFYKCVESGLDNGLNRAIQSNPYARHTADSVDFYRGWKEAQGKPIMEIKEKK
jgi:hypothetical protein